VNTKLFAGLWIAAVSFLLIPMSLFSSDKKQEAESLMSKASELSSLDSQGARPFHLYINFRLAGMTSLPTDGRYMWTAVTGEQWRQEIRFGDYSQVVIGNEGKLWEKRTLNFLPKPVNWITGLVGQFSSLKLLSDEKISRVYNDSHMRCVDLERQGDESQSFCFNSDGTLNSVQLPAEDATYQYSGYQKFGDKVFPQTLRVTDHGRLVVDALVEDLAFEEKPYAGLFAPPAGAEKSVGCSHPSRGKLIKMEQPNYPITALQLHRSGAVTVAIRIHPDGSVKVLQVTETAGKAMDDAAVKAISQWKYSPFMCGDTPVPVESDVTVAFKVQR
jgi:TonB family protein